MFAARLTQIICTARRGRREFHVVLAIQRAQRITLQPLMAVLAQLIDMRAAPFEQRLAKSGAAGSIAERVDFKFNFETQLTPELIDHDHKFCVAGRIGASKNLHPELIELAKATLL